MLLPYPSYHTFDFTLNCKDKLIRFFFLSAEDSSIHRSQHCLVILIKYALILWILILLICMKIP